MPFFGQRQRGLDVRKDMSKTAAGAVSSNRREPAMRGLNPAGYEMGQQAARQAGAQQYDAVRRQHDADIRAWAEFGLRKDAQKHKQTMDKADFGYRMREQGMESVPGVMGGDPVVGQRPQMQTQPQGTPHTVVGHPEYGTVYRVSEGGFVNAKGQAMRSNLTFQPTGNQGMRVAPGGATDMYGAVQGQKYRNKELEIVLTQAQIDEIWSKPQREQAAALAKAMEAAREREYKKQSAQQDWNRKRQAAKEDHIYERELEAEQFDREQGAVADERKYNRGIREENQARAQEQQAWKRKLDIHERVNKEMQAYYDIMLDSKGKWTDAAKSYKKDWLGTGEEKTFSELTRTEQRQLAERDVKRYLGISDEPDKAGASGRGMDEESKNPPQSPQPNAPQAKGKDKPKRSRDAIIGDLQAKARAGDAEAQDALRQMGVRW